MRTTALFPLGPFPTPRFAAGAVAPSLSQAASTTARTVQAAYRPKRAIGDARRGWDAGMTNSLRMGSSYEGVPRARRTACARNAAVTSRGQVAVAHLAPAGRPARTPQRCGGHAAQAVEWVLQVAACSYREAASACSTSAMMSF